VLVRLDQHLADLLLDRTAAVGAEACRDLFGELLAALLERLRELLRERAHVTLELGVDEVDVRRRALALDHTGADLDRARDRLGWLAALALLIADDAGGARVDHLEALDHEPVLERADGPVRVGIERELWSLRSLHGRLSKVVAVPDGT
jgi:hypothetical protein